MINKGKNGGTLHSWERGKSGNPKGRPQGGFLGRLFNEFTQDFLGCDHIEVTVTTGSIDGRPQFDRISSSQDGWFAVASVLVAIKLLTKAAEGDLKAIKLLTDITEGKATRSINIRDTYPAFTTVWPDNDGNIVSHTDSINPFC